MQEIKRLKIAKDMKINDIVSSPLKCEGLFLLALHGGNWWGVDLHGDWWSDHAEEAGKAFSSI